MVARKWMWIGWPAFLAASLMEMLVFAVVDPHDLHWFSHPLDLSARGVYTLAFFAFWAITSLACTLALSLAATPEENEHVASHRALLAHRHGHGGCC